MRTVEKAGRWRDLRHQKAKVERARRVLLEALESRQLLDGLPSTAITLELQTPVTHAQQSLTMTARVSGSDPAVPVTGRVAFLELVDPAIPYYLFDPARISFTDPSTGATQAGDIVGTAAVGADGAATLTVGSIPSGSAAFTGRFRAVYLGDDPLIALPKHEQVIEAQPDQQFGYVPGMPWTGDHVWSTAYLVYPNGNEALSLTRGQITVLADIAGTHPSMPPVMLEDGGTHVIGASDVPIVVVDTVDFHPSPIYPNTPATNYYATFTAVPALAGFDSADPTLASSISPVGTFAADQPTEPEIQTSPGSTVTNPPVFSVSILSTKSGGLVSKFDAAPPARGTINFGDAGLLISTDGNSAGLVSWDGGGGTAYVGPDFVPPDPVPTGSVRFYDGDTLLASVPLDANGNATWAPDSRSLALGTHQLHVTYSGDAVYSPSQADPPAFTLTHTPTRAEIITSNTSVHAGEILPLVARISTAVPDLITPTGNVTFSEGDTVLATVALGDTAPIHLDMAVGDHVITITYAGDGDCLPSTASATVTILPANPATPTTPTPAATPPPIEAPPVIVNVTPPAIVDPPPGDIQPAPGDSSTPTPAGGGGAPTAPSIATSITLSVLTNKKLRKQRPMAVLATVLSSDGTAVAAAPVTLYIDGTVVATVPGGGVIDLKKLKKKIKSGRHTIYATYAGDETTVASISSSYSVKIAGKRLTFVPPPKPKPAKARKH